MLVQNPDMEQYLTKLADALLNDLILIFSEAIDGCSSDRMRGLGLRTIIAIVINLFSSLRCQRAFYSLHDEVHVGAPYDPEYMESLDPNEDVDSSSVVAGIIARGIVRRPHEGSCEVLGIVSRSKVFLRSAEVMPMH